MTESVSSKLEGRLYAAIMVMAMAGITFWVNNTSYEQREATRTLIKLGARIDVNAERNQNALDSFKIAVSKNYTTVEITALLKSQRDKQIILQQDQIYRILRAIESRHPPGRTPQPFLPPQGESQ